MLSLGLNFFRLAGEKRYPGVSEGDGGGTREGGGGCQLPGEAKIDHQSFNITFTFYIDHQSFTRSFSNAFVLPSLSLSRYIIRVS